jgi:hypothetical protein
VEAQGHRHLLTGRQKVRWRAAGDEQQHVMHCRQSASVPPTQSRSATAVLWSCLPTNLGSRAGLSRHCWPARPHLETACATERPDTSAPRHELVAVVLTWQGSFPLRPHHEQPCTTARSVRGIETWLRTPSTHVCTGDPCPAMPNRRRMAHAAGPRLCRSAAGSMAA